MPEKSLIISILALSHCIVWGQNLNGNPVLASPISSFGSLSGGYGEIRTDHFHSGIDIRTKGKTGLRVYATDEGWIARIKVSPIGFGKTLYIQHPNGYTTVYAHLDQFSEPIGRYVKKAQYAQKSFEIEIFPKPYEIKVGKGDVIGLSGNSGSSGGPHLHYEVRNTLSQAPLNPLHFHANVGDKFAPIIKTIHVYGIDNTGYTCISKIDSQRLKGLSGIVICPDTIKTSGETGIGINTYDIVNSESTRCGVVGVSVRVNRQLVYDLNIDGFSFAETRYANSVVDFETKQIANEEIVKCWADPNNKFSGIKQAINRGVIHVAPDSIYKVEVRVRDASQNTTEVHLVIKGLQKRTRQPIPVANSRYYMPFDKVNKFDNDTFRLRIPQNVLYNNLLFNYQIDHNNRKAPPLVAIHSPNTPIHSKMDVELKIIGIPERLTGKVFAAKIEKDKKVKSFGGIASHGYLQFQTNSFGVYTVMVDTVAPEIKPLNVAPRKNMQGIGTIRFMVKDSLSGVSKYEGKMDGQWALFEWDPKNDLLYYTLDSTRISKGQNHLLELFVVDAKENESRYRCEFFW
jgi:hypothetical protein